MLVTNVGGSPIFGGPCSPWGGTSPITLPTVPSLPVLLGPAAPASVWCLGRGKGGELYLPLLFLLQGGACSILWDKLQAYFPPLSLLIFDGIYLLHDFHS